MIDDAGETKTPFFKELSVTADSSGKAIVLLLSTPDGQSPIAFSSAILNQVILDLLLYAIHPKVSPHVDQDKRASVAPGEQFIALPVNGAAPLAVRQGQSVGLALELNGGFRLNFQFGVDQSKQLIESLQRAVSLVHQSGPEH